jgi:hypothetical protein
MINDKGFSRIVSVIIIVAIIALVGAVFLISSSSNDEDFELVDIMENDIKVEEIEEDELPNFIGLDMSAGGYKIVDQNLENKSSIVIERVDGQYKLLTSNLNQDTVLVVKSFWQDKENGAKEVFELTLETGEINKVFSLSNFQIDSKRKFITGAVYSADKQKIAYSTNLYDEEKAETSEIGSTSIEVWEYDIAKDMHTLITNVNGGVYSGLKMLGYDSLQENIIIYQFVADGAGSELGRVYFINIEQGIMDKDSFQLALDNYFSQTDEADNRVKTVGYPYLSPTSDYIAFILPSMFYLDDLSGNNNEVVIYDFNLHKISSIYVDDSTTDIETINPVLSDLYWVGKNLYIPSPDELAMYNVDTKKLRSIYKWSGGNESHKLFAITDNSVLIQPKMNIAPIYIDFTTAVESELLGLENFEYINIYYK